MHFVRTEDLKTGMRLARPVYNKKSILLFDRNSLLSLQAIESIRNFGLSVSMYWNRQNRFHP